MLTPFRFTIALAHHISFYYAKSVSFELSCHFNFTCGILNIIFGNYPDSAQIVSYNHQKYKPIPADALPNDIEALFIDSHPKTTNHLHFALINLTLGFIMKRYLFCPGLFFCTQVSVCNKEEFFFIEGRL